MDKAAMDTIAEQQAEIESLRAHCAHCDGTHSVCRHNEKKLMEESDRLKIFIEGEGYRRCDVMACNCGDYHGGHAHERLNEIGSSLVMAGVDCGGTLLAAVEGLVAELSRLRKIEEAAKAWSEYSCAHAFADTQRYAAKETLAGRGPTENHPKEARDGPSRRLRI